jgi:phenylalanyl-tRNA synthetase beta chain
MLISKNWLEKYIPEIGNIEDSEIAEKFTAKLAEVESIEYVGKDLDKLVVGVVESVEKHPKADKLKVCQVDVGFDKVQIVCGASNVSAKQHVVVCLPGGSVLDAKTGEKVGIEKAELRGVESNGMICSEKELGISEEHEGIMVLGNNYQQGQEIDDLIKDTIFEIENKSLTHRGDCFSHLGIARELAAILDIDFEPPQPATDPIQTESLPIEISVETDKCSRFAAITIKGVEVQESPFWLKSVLKSIGMRPVNNIVDISNYMMHDLGQPIHIYDYKKIKDNKLIAREARKGEKIKAINENTYTANEGDIVIADNNSLQGIAGIIGSLHSEVEDETEDIVIECALFDTTSILKTARQLGVNTDASVRFSKGVDPEMTLEVLKTTANLVTDLAGGEIGSEILDINREDGETEERTISLDLQEVKKLTGETIETEEMLVYMERLHLQIKNRNNISTSENVVTVPKVVEVIVPPRRRDLDDSVDLIEEITRIHGYEKITPVAPEGDLKAEPANQISRIRRNLNSLLVALDYEENVGYSFISEETKQALNLPKRKLLKIENAISPELKYVRNSIAISLLEAYAKNNNKQSQLKLFEFGRIVDNYNYTEEGIPEQPWHLGLLSAVENEEQESKYGITVKHTKSEVMALIEGLGIDTGELRWQAYEKKDNVFLEEMVHPYRCSTLVDNDGSVIAIVAEVSPLIIRAMLDNDVRVVVGELEVNKLQELQKNKAKSFSPVANLPAITRDLSFWIDEENVVGKMVNKLQSEIEQSKIEVRPLIWVSDEYSNEENRLSITISIKLQPTKTTLTREETTAVIDKAAKRLEQNYKVEYRN